MDLASQLIQTNGEGLGHPKSVFHQLKSFNFSHTPDRDFRRFYPCEISLAHIPVPAHGKEKKKTATHQRHVRSTSICDIIVMLKLCHYVATHRIQDSLEVFFRLFQNEIRYLVVNKKHIEFINCSI